MEKRDFEHTKRGCLAYYLCSLQEIERVELKMKKETQENLGAERLAPANVEDGVGGKRASGARGRRRFLQAGLLGGVAAAGGPVLQSVFGASPRGAAAPVAETAEVPAFELDEITIGELQDGMKSGKYSARTIAEKYLARIAAIDESGPRVNSVIETNPDALEIAEALDQERKEKGPRGQLHGIPILIKDNIATADRMMTTAGSLALVGSKPPRDAFLAQKLREAGAVILGKTNLSEWANIRSNHSISGWSGRGGQTRNPYALDRNPCGSSSGTGAGISANLAAVGIGTETDGSIVCPSSANGLAGITRRAAGLGKVSVTVLPATRRVRRNCGSCPGSLRLAQWQDGLPQRRRTAVREPGRRSPKLRNSSRSLDLLVSKVATSSGTRVSFLYRRLSVRIYDVQRYATKTKSRKRAPPGRPRSRWESVGKVGISGNRVGIALTGTGRYFNISVCL
jgi:hypothetical protein